MTTPLPSRSRIDDWERTAAQLGSVAGQWRSRADWLEQSADLFLSHAQAPGGSVWAGPAAQSVAADAHCVRSRVYRGAEQARRMAEIADRGAEGLRWGRQSAMTAIDAAERDGFVVADDLSLAEREWSVGPLDEARLRAAHTHREQIRHRVTRLLAEDDRIAAQLCAGFTEFTGTAGTADAADDARVWIPPPRTAPAEVYAWWESLSPRQKLRLFTEHPPELGNLNGIPAQIRSGVNLAVLHDDIARIESADEPVASATDMVRYRNAIRTRSGLQSARARGCPALLWAYEPLAFGGKGRAAVSLGDPDDAQNTTVIVPGVGSSVAQDWLAQHHDATNLYQQSRIADPARSTAVIAWLGYDAPDGFWDARLSEPGLARGGGELLARDVNGLWETHAAPTPQHVTVIGHSYGGTTVADAFAESHMHANDAILLGCPGTDTAHNATAFGLDGGRVYVGSASTDPVSWIGQTDGIAGELAKGQIRQHGIPLPLDAGLGCDPAGQGYGSIRFHAEIAGSGLPTLNDHVRYYQLGGEALRGMTDIATGHAERLVTDGLLAQSRRQPHIGTPSTLHLPGLPPIPLPHIDMRMPGLPAYIDPEGERHGISDDHAYSTRAG